MSIIIAYTLILSTESDMEIFVEGITSQVCVISIQNVIPGFKSFNYLLLYLNNNFQTDYFGSIEIQR